MEKLRSPVVIGGLAILVKLSSLRLSRPKPQPFESKLRANKRGLLLAAASRKEESTAQLHNTDRLDVISTVVRNMT